MNLPMNLRRSAPAALLISAALALAGCGQTTTPATSPANTVEPASAAASQAAGQPRSAAPTPTPTPKAFTGAELTAIIAGLADGEGNALTVVPAEQLEKGIEISKQTMSEAVISPAECAVVADSNAQIPAGSTYAGGVAKSTTVQAVTVVTLVAVADQKQLGVNLEAAVAKSKKCTNFSMEIRGQKITSQTEILPVKTSADTSFGSLATQTLPSGQLMTTLLVTGVKGNLSASAVATGPDVTRAAAATLARLVDEALAQGATRS